MKAIIWDFGRVLFRWEPEEISSLYFPDRELAHRICQDLLIHEDWAALDAGRITLDDFIARGSQRCGLAIEVVRDFIAEHLPNEITLIPETFQIVKHLKNQGISQLFLSNIGHHVFACIEARYKISSYFSGGIVSAQETCIKPESEIYRRLLARYHLVAEACIFIDDRLENITAAQTLGIQGILYTGTKDLEQNLKKHGFITRKAHNWQEDKKIGP